MSVFHAWRENWYEEISWSIFNRRRKNETSSEKFREIWIEGKETRDLATKEVVNKVMSSIGANRDKSKWQEPEGDMNVEKPSQNVTEDVDIVQGINVETSVTVDSIGEYKNDFVDNNFCKW